MENSSYKRAHKQVELKVVAYRRSRHRENFDVGHVAWNREMEVEFEWSFIGQNQMMLFAVVIRKPR